jgi:tRNA pseudouridine13 synthase
MEKRWPTLLDPPIEKGIIRTEPQDFFVEEIPAYLPSGQGSHLMILIEKCLLNTEDVVRALSRHLDISPRDIGYAGLKDRKAVTRQWFSVPASTQENLANFTHDQIMIQKTGLHTNKIKTGHLKGNRFEVLIRTESKQAHNSISQRIESLKTMGLPNYYGPQRFGRDGKNEDEGMRILSGHGPKYKSRKLRLLLSALQSGLFNDLLAKRIRQGLFNRVLEGDILVKDSSGGIFECTDPLQDQPRLEAFEIHPTGPIFGNKMKPPSGQPAKMEQEILKSHNLDEACWKKFPKLTRGTRRSLRIHVKELSVRQLPTGVCLSFILPAGSYATSLLRELVRFTEYSDERP